MAALQLHPLAGVPGEHESECDLAGWIRTLYEDAGSSDCLFASPLGPVAVGGRSLLVPQFVYFGLNLSADPVRLAVLSGFDPTDFRGSRAVLALVSELAAHPDIGQGLSVSFFPVVNARMLAWGGGQRSLAGELWSTSKEPELALLRRNAATQRYQGFIILRSSPDREPGVTVRTACSRRAGRPNGEVFTPADFAPWPVRFESVFTPSRHRGPLALGRPWDYGPFEVEITVPVRWEQPRWDHATVPLLRRLLISDRGFISHGANP